MDNQILIDSLDSVIRSRKSVRIYSNESLNKEVVKKCKQESKVQ